LISNRFGDKVNVLCVSDDGITGNFEIVLNGELIHSKKTAGDGFLTNRSISGREQLEALLARIQSALDLRADSEGASEEKNE
jgi:hypothetical protein